MRTDLQERAPQARQPAATYRLQFSGRFNLRQAAELVPYLSELGVSHLYASPLLLAVPGSPHGYDVCDFHRLNPDLGTDADFEALIATLRRHNMGLVLDVVANHMGIGSPENRWWWQVLEHGRATPLSAYFDIDWEPPDPLLRNKVLLPILADRYDQVLEKRELRLEHENGGFTLRYRDQRLPVTPTSEGLLLHRIAELGRGGLQASEAISAAMSELNADRAALDALVQQQHYRLAYWRQGDQELNYRRFFEVVTLAGIRMEDPRVFADAHLLIGQWLDRGLLDGLRVDHIDGLRDPEMYLQRLRRLAPQAWIIVEKILQPGELLPSNWPVAGTTGYDFLNRVGGVFVNPEGERPLTEFYAEFTGQTVDYPTLVREKKRLVLAQTLPAEVNRLTALLLQVSDGHSASRDFTLQELRDTLTELIAAFPVYRTYVRADAESVNAVDAACVSAAVTTAREQRPDIDPAQFDFLQDLLLRRLPGEKETEFFLRFQQLTGPAMAKGVEDTAFYCFNRLVSLNEVGGDPSQFGLSVEAFHQACAAALARWPQSMLATSTHDTKRSEDVRARLHVLTEMPARWRTAVGRWSALNERLRRNGWPDHNAEYLYYQTLVGAWPLELSRALAYMEKATCEAKVHTSWTCRNPEYDTALHEFVAGTFGSREFMKDLEQFVASLVEPGWINSLAQTLLKLTAPGVPDLYQGTELWDLSLVDPDNRRPVDFALRHRLLNELKSIPIEAVWQRRAEGLPKLWLIRQTLDLRRRHPDLFCAVSPYEPLAAKGAKAEHALAFIRGGASVTVVPRLVLGLGGDWADTILELPSNSWHNELTGETFSGGPVPLANLLKRFPVALLARKEND